MSNKFYGKFSEKGWPHKGWRYDGSEDSGQFGLYSCEACGSPIRYLHHISHDEANSLTVGVKCCENLTEDYLNPRTRERVLKRKPTGQPAFKAWVQSKLNEDSPVGDLVRDINRVPEFPMSKAFKRNAEFLISRGACYEAVQALIEVWPEYSNRKIPKKYLKLYGYDHT